MVTVKLKKSEAEARFKNGQSGTVTYSLEDFYNIYAYEKAYKDFIDWSHREYIVYGQGRTKAYNNSVKGNLASNHLMCLARDTYFKDISWDKERFLKYAKKWKMTCEKYGLVGEMGWYPDYVYNGCQGMIHIGVSKNSSFIYWVTKDGKQTNNIYGRI